MVKLRAWAAPTLGGGLRITAAAPGADVLLKPLLNRPLLARDVHEPQGLIPAQQQKAKEQSSACHHLGHGLLFMNRFRHLICLKSEAQLATASPVRPLPSCTADYCQWRNIARWRTRIPASALLSVGAHRKVTSILLQPCVGVWMAGLGDLSDPHLWAACMQFLLSKSIKDKVLQPDMAFLVALLPPGKSPTVMPLPWGVSSCQPHLEATHLVTHLSQSQVRQKHLTGCG